MKLRLNIILLILIGMPLLANCQSAPGYLGKKITFGLGFGLRPGLQGPDKKNRGTEAFQDYNNKIALDFSFNAEIGYTLSRKVNLSLLLLNNSTAAVAGFRSPILYGNGNESSDSFFHNFLAEVKVFSFGALYNIHKVPYGNISPLGNAFSIGFKRNIINASVLEQESDFSSFEINEDLSNLPIDPRITSNSLLIAFTNTQIFWDMFYLKTRFMFAGNIRGIRLAFDDTFDYSASPQESFENDILLRLQKYESINIDLSAGIIF